MKSWFPVVALFLFCNIAVCQTLTVSSSHLNFGTVFENSPDSLPITIYNSTGRDITVTDIRFYSTYGQEAFSTPWTWFTIADGSSTVIFVKFSPRHNILHNSEMVIENDGLRGFVSVNLTGQGRYSNSYYGLTENLSEEGLKNAINLITGNGYISLGYGTARDSMFMSIDNEKTNGQGAAQNTLECVYTGREAVGYVSRTDCQTNYAFNTEHTFPQALFSSMEPMRSDLHHLFPTDDVANNQRADDPFGTVSNPTWSSGGSKTNGTLFEPRDLQKGRAARSLFYFILRYQNYSNFLNSQETTLRNWHTTFPPDGIETTRNAHIFQVQNNRNPFVDYPVFTERITTLSTTSAAQLNYSIDISEDTLIYGTIAASTVALYNFVIVNDGNADISFSNFALTHPSELSFAAGGNDTIIAPGESLTLQIRYQSATADSVRGFLSFNTNATGNAFVNIPLFVNDFVFTSREEIFKELSIAPIPASGKIRVLNKNFIPGSIWTINDIAGRVVVNGQFSNSDEWLDVSNCKSGMYLLRIFSPEGNTTRRIIIQ